jgi:hypothetical protein
MTAKKTTAKKASVKTTGGAPDGRVEWYERLIAANPSIQQKGATHPYTSLNGNMFSYLHPTEGMALRLPEAEREKFLKKYDTTLFEAYGVVQREYVRVPDELLKNTEELGKYLDVSYRYAGTLKPKPTKKKA